jgi:hypothetical protein
MNKLTNMNILLLFILLCLILSSCRSSNIEQFSDVANNYIEATVGTYLTNQDIVSSINCIQPFTIGTFVVPDNLDTLKDIQLSIIYRYKRLRPSGMYGYGFPSSFDNTNYPVVYSIYNDDTNIHIQTRYVYKTNSFKKSETFPWSLPENLMLIPGQTYSLAVRICPPSNSDVIVKLELLKAELKIRYFMFDQETVTPLCIGPVCANYSLWNTIINNATNLSPTTLCIGDNCIDNDQLVKIINKSNEPTPTTPTTPTNLCIGDTCIDNDQLAKIINKSNEPTPRISTNLCIGDTCINENQLAKLINTSNRTTALPHEHDDDSGIMSKCLIL